MKEGWVAIAQEILRELPSIESVLQELDEFATRTGIPQGLITQSARQVIGELRQAILSGAWQGAEADVRVTVLEEVKRHVQESWAGHLRRAVNATGVLLHTGLGRAPLSPEAKCRVDEVLEGYVTLEIDSEDGKRRERHFHIEALLSQVTGAEAGIIVNNNAAATLLVLNTLAKGCEAIVSRGELVEIGGSFRMPEIMAQSGAIMREVGTTNKTHLRDYETALSENTGLILKVHTSNYRIVGFTSEVLLKELAHLAKQHGLPVYYDLGSGALIDFSRYGLPHEPTVQESLAAGADLVTFSGDKLMGGPQAGIIVGKRQYIDLIKKNPLTRTMRCCKLTYAAVEATLKLFLDEATAVKRNVTLRKLLEPVETLRKRALALLAELKRIAPSTIKLTLEECITFAGGGALPEEPIPTIVISLCDEELSSEEIAYRLRQHSPPVFARVQGGRVMLDFRTIDEEEIPVLAQALKNLWEARS